MTGKEAAMERPLRETAADVAALIPRFSWELMDEDQRDALMEKVVLPRYMRETKDGVKLGPAFWAEVIGAETSRVIRGRIERLKARSEAGLSGLGQPNGQSPHQVHHVRSAKSAIKKHPELAAEVLKDPEVRKALTDAIANDAVAADHMEEALAKTAPPSGRSSRREKEPSAIDLVADLRSMHRTIDRVAAAVVSGQAVVSKGMADAIVEEVRWLKNALDAIEAGVKSDSLDRELERLLDGTR